MVFSAPTQGQTLAPSWYQQNPQTSPPSRYIDAVTYDAAHGQVVLFGGYGHGADLNDTWLWNGTNWTEANPATIPPARAAEAMVYDAAHGNVVMFGGLVGVGTRLGDTWIWNGTNWTEATPANSPAGRASTEMVYDAATRQVLLFGGLNTNGQDLGDTWVWNGTNWTQLFPTNSPSARDSYSMVYDAALGEVVLFGGSANGVDQNDTWTWNGTNWTQLVTANSPQARQSQGMAYNAALGQVVMFSGYSGSSPNGSFLMDTWLFNGTNWTPDFTATSPSARYAPNGMTYDAARQQVLLFGGYATVQDDDTWEWGLPGNFGNINVCPAAQSTPAPCTSTVGFTYNITSTTTFGTPKVVEQGTPGPDYNFGSNTSCTGTVSPGTCTVNVTFTPVSPGLRSGALELVDGTGNLLVSTPIYGNGQGPAAAIGPGIESLLNTGDYSFEGPQGVALDPKGNVYVANVGSGQVVKVSPAGNVSTVATGLSSPQGLAFDGAGDLFIADSGLEEVVEVPSGCASSSCHQVLGQNLQGQLGVAVDGAGDVFIGDNDIGEVVESPVGCTTSACQIVVYSPAGAAPAGLAVDAAGDLFIADPGLHQVAEIPSGCTVSACQATVGHGWNQPIAVAVDAAGNAFVADQTQAAVVEVPAGCTTSSCQSTVFGGVNPLGVAVDPAGDVFVAGLNTNEVYEVNRSQAPSLTFASTSVGSTSSDSPKSVFLENIGNQTLSAVGPGLSAGGPNFAQVAGSGTLPDCSSSFSLPPGQSCNLSLSFAPTMAGNPLTSAAVLTDNALNAASATQSIALSGVGVAAAGSTLSVTEIGSGSGTVTDNLGQINCTETNGATAGSCTGTYSNGTQVTLSASASGSSKFLGWGGVCASAGTSSTCSIAFSQAANATASFVNQNLGSVHVCPPGTNTPGTCTITSPISFNLAATTTIGAIKVVTQGATGLDFTLSSGTCAGTIPAGNACTANVVFTPLAAGLRLAAIELFDNNANLVASAPIYGVGQEPEIAFSPAPQARVNTTASYPLAAPKGITVDAAGDTFIADTGAARVVKVAANGIASTVGSGLQSPQGLAVDGAGNLFIADNLLNEVVEVPFGCATASCQTTVGVGLSGQSGVAVDGAGNVFIDAAGTSQVVEVPAGCTTNSCQIVTYNQGEGSSPVGIALDAAGDLFVADARLAKVIEVPAGCTSSSCHVTVGQGFAQPTAVAVDAAGDVFVADPSLQSVTEVPAGCTSAGCQAVVLPAIDSVGVAVDGAGDVFTTDAANKQAVKLSRPQPPALGFAQTNAGATSSDSPQALLVQNVGNQPLTGSLALNLGTSFTQGLATDCTSAFPLAPGATCRESFSFKPQSATYFSGTALLSDNALNTTQAGAQQITLSGVGATAGVAGTVAVPNLVGLAQTAVTTPIAAVGLVTGTLNTAASSTVPAGSVIDQTPAAGTQVSVGSAVNLLVSSGIAQPTAPNPLSFNNNYFVTGDYVAAGVTLRGTGKAGMATGTITIPTYAQSTTAGVPPGADIIDAFLYWETLENTAVASSTNGTFDNYPIVGQQIGDDQPNYADGKFTGTIRSYRADVNEYLPVGANGIRFAAGTYTVGLPDSGGAALPLTQGASLVIIYRVLSPNFPLKAVVIYDGAAVPASTQTQPVQGFYDAVGGASGTGKATSLYASAGTWNTSVNPSTTLGASSQYSAPLTAGSAYAAVILSTPVNNSDNDGILDAWKTGPPASDFHAGQPGYYDAKTATWVGLPGAKHGQKDLFVQLDYMCGNVLASGACDPAQENLFPSPDINGNDPLAMTQQAFAASGVQLHLTIGNAIPESTCTDNLAVSPPQLCQFPNEPGVVGWKNSVEFAKLYPRNLAACLSGGDCTTRFPYGQKDSYHYVLFGHSLAIPAWNTRYGTLTSITVANGITTIVTADRGSGINRCPGRITLEGVLGDPALNGVYNTASCPDTKTITVATPGVPNYTYPNTTLPEPAIGLTSGTVTSISGYSDLGGSDSAVTLGLWLTAPNQDMSKRANVIAGTLFHEIGHTLGLSHGGLYYDTPGSYVPTFDANCKPNFQSVMNYLFQLDLVGPNQSLAFSNQTLIPINENAAGSISQLTDTSGNPATFPTSAWYVPTPPGPAASAATLHCDGTPLAGEQGYRIDSSVAPMITPAWTNGEDLSFTGTLQPNERGYNDLANLDLRQVGATGGEFASLATLLSFGSSVAPLNISSGGNVTLGSGGTVAVGSGGTVTLGSGGNVTLGSGGTITLGSGGNVTLGSGGVVTLGKGGSVNLGTGTDPALATVNNITGGSGGPSATELTYDTANSVVRPPSSPGETTTAAGVLITWKAPAFGVVQTYTVYRSSNGATAMVIGSVSGVNGNPPATEFLDTNPDLTSKVVVYTITTTLVPDSFGPSRQSGPSAPAVLKNNQSISLAPLPSSVLITNPPTVTATAMTNGAPNGLEVFFSAAGSCSISSQSLASNVSSATVTLATTGSCTITASQPGTTMFNPANSVSGTFMVLPQGSSAKSQTINFASLPNVQYGSSFSLSASASSGLPVSFTASGPCTNAGKINGAGVCRITASVAANGTYSAASLTQSFTIDPAVLTVAANNLVSAPGQPIPPLTYNYVGFVNGDTSSVVSGAPALSTTATPTSSPGSYPITVSTGTLAASNYSFLYVSGTLTVQSTSQSQTITFTTNPPSTAAYNSSFTVAATASSGAPVSFTSSGACSNSGATYTMTNSTGTCSVIANQVGNASYAPAPQVTKTVTATGPLLSVSPSAINFGQVYLRSIHMQTVTLTNIGTAPVTINDPFFSIVKGGNSNEFLAVSLCPRPLAVGKSCGVVVVFTAGPFYTPQDATLEIMSNAPGSPQAVSLTATVIDPQVSVNPKSLQFGTIKHGASSTLTVTLSNPGATPLSLTNLSVTGTNASAFAESSTCGSSVAAGASCTVSVKFTPPAVGTFNANLALADNAQAGGGTQTVPLSGTGN